MAGDTQKKKILHIISGFLGAGKTTFISALLETNPFQESMAVCVNEFAAQGVDGIIFRDKVTDVKELSAGCICCTLKSALNASLASLVHTADFDRLLIEPSGVAKLSEVLDAVNNPSLRRYLAVGSSTTIVDSLHFHENLDACGEIFADQIQYADNIVLSKTSGQLPENIDALCCRLKEMNPGARIFGNLWDAGLLKEIFGGTFTRPSDRSAAAGTSGSASGLSQSAALGGGQPEEEVRQPFQSVLVNVDKHLGREEMEGKLEKLCADPLSKITRIKGIVTGKDGGSLKVDYVHGTGKVENSNLPPTNHIVVIGPSLDFMQITTILGT